MCRLLDILYVDFCYHFEHEIDYLSSSDQEYSLVYTSKHDYLNILYWFTFYHCCLRFVSLIDTRRVKWCLIIIIIIIIIMYYKCHWEIQQSNQPVLLLCKCQFNSLQKWLSELVNQFHLRRDEMHCVLRWLAMFRDIIGVGIVCGISAICVFTGWLQKSAPFLYALTLPNINRFSKLFYLPLTFIFLLLTPLLAICEHGILWTGDGNFMKFTIYAQFETDINWLDFEIKRS